MPWKFVVTATESVSGVPKLDVAVVELPVTVGVAMTTVVESADDFDDSTLPALSVAMERNE